MSRSAASMAKRRDEKFEKHQIEIKEEKRSDTRIINGNEESVNFTHAVYAKRGLVGRTHSYRQALKLAHQRIRNVR